LTWDKSELVKLSKYRYRLIREYYGIPEPPKEINEEEFLRFYEEGLVYIGDLLVEENYELALMLFQTFQKIVEELIETIRELINQVQDWEVREELQKEFKAGRYKQLLKLRGLTYDEFLELFKLRPRKDREEREKYADIRYHPLWKPIYDLFELDEREVLRITTKYSPDIKGYFEFLKDYSSKKVLKKILEAIHPLFLKERDFERHAYITGMTGSGKSELMKFIVYHLLYKKIPFFSFLNRSIIERIKPNKSVFVIDPHGDLAHQIYRWYETQYILRKAQRPPLKVVYFDPFLCKDKKPVLNPFDIKDKSEDMIDLVSQEIARVFKELIKDSRLSLQMETLLIPCIATLLRRENSTLRDLQRFMNDNLNEDLVEEGMKSPNPAHRDFFKNAFYSKHYTPTKQSIYTKIQSLLNSKTFHDITIGKSTIDLEELMNTDSLVIFNLSKGKLGSDTSEALGRMIIALLTSFAFKRANIPESERQRTFLFVDEFHNYIGDSLEVILTESRKYKLFLVLAQQFLGQGMDTQLKNAILSNTYLKFIGMNALNTLKALSSETGITLEELQKLKQGEFFVKKGTEKQLKIKVPSYLVGYRNEYYETAYAPLEKLYRASEKEDIMCKTPYYKKIKEQIESFENGKEYQIQKRDRKIKPKFEL